MALTFEGGQQRPVETSLIGVGLIVTPPRDATTNIPWTGGIEIERAPDSGGSPGTWVAIATLEHIPPAGGRFIDDRPWTTAVWWYRYRPVAGGGVGTYSDAVSATPGLFLRGTRLGFQTGDAATFHAGVRGDPLSDGKYAVVASATDGLTADATVKESGGKAINKLLAKPDATDPDHLDSVPDGVTYSRPLATRISAGKPLIDFAEAIHANKVLDNIADGATYARLLAAKLSAGALLRSGTFSDGKYAVAASATDGLTADAGVKDSTGAEIRLGFKKSAHTDPDTANSVADGTTKRVVTLDEGTAVSELGLQLAQAESIVMNGDFERGMRYWRRDSTSVADSTVTIETGGNKYSGDKSLKLALADTGNLLADQVDRLGDDSDSTAGNLVYIPADGAGLGWEVHGRAISKKGSALETGTLSIQVKQYDASKSLITTITVASLSLGTTFGEFGGGVALGSTTRFITMRLQLNGTSGGVTAYVDDLKAWIEMPKLRCKVYNSGAQSITSGSADVQLAWDSEDHDIGGLHSTASNTGRITPPPLVGPGFGMFLLIAQVQWAAGTTGYRRVKIRKDDGSGGKTTLAEDTRGGTPTVETTQIVTAYISRFVYDSATPEFFEVNVTHTQGANLNVNGGVAASYFAFIQLW